MCHFSVITYVKMHRDDTISYINLQCMYYVLLHFECYEYVSIIHTYTCTTLVFTEIFNNVWLKGFPHFDKMSHSGLKYGYSQFRGQNTLDLA